MFHIIVNRIILTSNYGMFIREVGLLIRNFAKMYFKQTKITSHTAT